MGETEIVFEEATAIAKAQQRLRDRLSRRLETVERDPVLREQLIDDPVRESIDYAGAHHSAVERSRIGRAQLSR
jgi:hypothetical protein